MASIVQYTQGLAYSNDLTYKSDNISKESPTYDLCLALTANNDTKPLVKHSHSPSTPSLLNPSTNQRQLQTQARNSKKPTPTLHQSLLKKRLSHNISKSLQHFSPLPKQNHLCASTTATKPNSSKQPNVTHQSNPNAKLSTLSLSPKATFPTLPVSVQHALLCSSLRHVFKAHGLSPPVQLLENAQPCFPQPPQASLPELTSPAQDLEAFTDQASPDEDVPMSEADGAGGDAIEDGEVVAGADGTADEIEDGEVTVAPGENDSEGDKENAEEDELIEDQEFRGGRSPTPAYRSVASVRTKKAPVLFHPTAKRPPPAPPTERRARPKTWANTVRAASPHPRALKQALGGRSRRGKKMEYKTDRVAKPLQHVPIRPEKQCVGGLADIRVDTWIEGLLDFFDAGVKRVAHPNVPQRGYVEHVRKALEVVEEMNIAVKTISVEVFERTQLPQALAALQEQHVDERWGQKAMSVMKDIARAANVVTERMKVEARERRRC